MTYKSNDSTVGIRVALARTRTPVSRVAEAINKTPQTVSRKLSGQLPITLDELHAIADMLGVPVASLIEDHPVSA